jgi:general secretion pathway protein D
VIPPGSPVPGTAVPPGAAPKPLPSPTAPPGAATIPNAGEQPKEPAAMPPAPAPAPAAPQPSAAAAGMAVVAVTPSGTQFNVGGGPYTVPISITNVSGLSTVSLTVTFNPAVVRVRSVQEGSFMRQGGAEVAFAQQVDSAAGRIDFTLTRTGDTVGAAGSGILASVLFDAVASGAVTFAPSGVASGPGGGVSLQFAPATVTVK